jgi:hypothetical protein
MSGKASGLAVGVVPVGVATVGVATVALRLLYGCSTVGVVPVGVVPVGARINSVGQISARNSLTDIPPPGLTRGVTQARARYSEFWLSRYQQKRACMLLGILVRTQNFYEKLQTYKICSLYQLSRGLSYHI